MTVCGDGHSVLYPGSAKAKVLSTNVADLRFHKNASTPPSTKTPDAVDLDRVSERLLQLRLKSFLGIFPESNDGKA
jgi:hypothetical protein